MSTELTPPPSPPSEATLLLRAWETYCRTVERNPWIPHRPHPKQQRFLLHTETTLEALFGGAAGGGKSEALLMAAVQFAETPGYAALLLRKSFRDLSQPDARIPRSKEWWGGRAHYSGLDKRWTFPSGATITFGYLEHADDVFQYQGSAFQFVGFDELTQFEETPYRYLFSRLRKGEGMAVPLRMRAGSNPGGKGHEWVKRRFITHRTGGRVFVPSRLEDNPSLDRAEYLRALAELDPITRAQLAGRRLGCVPGRALQEAVAQVLRPRDGPGQASDLPPGRRRRGRASGVVLELRHRGPGRLGKGDGRPHGHRRLRRDTQPRPAGPGGDPQAAGHRRHRAGDRRGVPSLEAALGGH